MPMRPGGAAGRSGWRSPSRWARSACPCCADNHTPEGDGMWRHVLYSVCVAEAALLAAALVAVVVQPDALGLAPSPRVRQLCGWSAVALMVGCGSALVGWLRALLAGARVRQSLIGAAMAGRPVH